MKVCIINNIYPPYHRGGAEQVIKRTVDGLIMAGHEVVLITASPRGTDAHKEGRLTTYTFKPWNLFFYTDAGEHNFILRFLWHVIDIFHIGSARFVREILTTEKPDVIHTHNLMGLGFLIPRVIRRLGLRHVHTVHDVQLVEPSAMILKQLEDTWRYTGFPTKIYSWIIRRLVGSPHVVISPSQFLLDFYSKRNFFSTSQKVVVRNPLTFDVNGSKYPSVDNAIIDFLYLGQIEHHKGIFLLIEAFKNIANATLHIVGSGSKLEEIRKITSSTKSIHVYGRIEREALPKLFSTMDVTVVPSLCYENSPTVIFESLHFGIPVLASKIEGIAELIEEGESGLTFEAGNVVSLQEKLEWCVAHPIELQTMSKKTTQILSELTKEDYVERLVELYGKK